MLANPWWRLLDGAGRGPSGCRGSMIGRVGSFSERNAVLLG
jgi:hypothetical protein